MSEQAAFPTPGVPPTTRDTGQTADQDKAARAISGRMVRAGGKESGKIIAVPLQALGFFTRGASLMAPVVVKPLGGASYVVATAANYAFWACHQAADLVQKTKLIESAGAGVQEIVHVGGELAGQSRERTGVAIQAGLTWGKWVLKPITWVSPGIVKEVIEGTADALSKGEEIERDVRKSVRQAELAHSWGGIKVAQVTLEKLTQAGGLAFKGLESGTEYLKNKSWQMWSSPQDVTGFFTKVADKVDAFAYTLTAEPAWIESAPKAGVVDAAYLLKQNIQTISQAHIEHLTRHTSKETRNEMYAFIEHFAEAFSLSEERLEAYQRVCSALQECVHDKVRLERLTKNPIWQKDAKEFLVLYQSIKEQIPSLFLLPERVVYPISKEVEALKVTPEEVAYVQTHQLEEEIEEIVRASKKVEIPSHASLTLEEAIGLFKRLPLLEKKAMLPPLHVELQVLPEQAASHVTDAEVAAFLQMAPSKKQDLIFGVTSCRLFALSDAQKKKYELLATVSACANDAVLASVKELIGLRKSIPSDEAHTLTPNTFRGLDPFLKIELFDLVKNYAKLGYNENKKLFEKDPRKLQTKAELLDFFAEYEDLIIKKFNTLPVQVKQKLYNVSFGQFQELTDPAREKLIEIIAAKINEEGSPKEKKLLLEMHETPTKKELEGLLKAFNRLFTKQERYACLEKLQGDVAFVLVEHDELEAAIKQCEREIAHAPAERRADLFRTKEWLEGYLHSTEHKSLDMVRIEELVGKHVISEVEEARLYALGDVTHDIVASVGVIPSMFFETLSWMSNPKLISITMHYGALGIERTLMVPLMQQYTMHALAKIPGVLTAEQALQFLPMTIMNGIHAAESWAVACMGSGVESFQKSISDLLTVALFKTEEKKAVEKGFETALAIEYKDLSKTVVDYCNRAESKQAVVCSKDVFTLLSNPAEAKKFSVEALKRIGETGKQVQAAVAEAPLSPIAQQVYNTFVANTETLVAETQSIFSRGWNAFRESAVGEIAGHFAAGLSKSALGDMAAMAKSAAGDTLSYVGATAQATAGAGVKLAKQAVGLEQALPPTVGHALDTLSQTASELAKVKAQIQAYKEALGRIEYIQTLPFGDTIKQLTVAYGPLALNVLEGIKKGVQYLDSMISVSKGMEKYLELQLETQSMKELEIAIQPPSFEEMLFGTVMKASFMDTALLLAKEGAEVLPLDIKGVSKWKQGLEVVSRGLVSGAVSAADAALLFGGGTFMLPLLMRHFVPALLRSYETAVSQNAGNFWGWLAESSFVPFEALGDIAQKAVTRLGASFMGVSSARIENFIKADGLTLDEQQHLVVLALASPHITEDEKKIIENRRGSLVDRGAKEDLRELGRTTLAVFDRMSAAEKLSLSPTMFVCLAQKEKDRVIELVAKYSGLSLSDYQNPDAIVAKFKTLSPSQQKELETKYLLSDYAQMTHDEQKDLLFTLAHSQAYRMHAPAKAGAMGIGLLESIAYYVELASEDDEKALRELARRELTEPQVPQVVQGLEHFHAFSNMTNNQLQKLLPLAAKLRDEERSLLTPSQLMRMGNAKIRHCFEIILDYHPQLLDACMTATHGRCNFSLLEESLQAKDTEYEWQKVKQLLVEALCSIFAQMPIAEQEEILAITDEEWPEMTAKSTLIRFLGSEPGLESSFSMLMQQQVAHSQGKPVNKDAIIFLFNGLPTSRKAEFRRAQEQEAKLNETMKSNVEKEAYKVQAQLKVFSLKIEEQKKVHEDYRLRLHNAERELARGAKAASGVDWNQVKKDSQTCLDETIDRIERLEHHARGCKEELALLAKISDLPFAQAVETSSKSATVASKLKHMDAVRNKQKEIIDRTINVFFNADREIITRFADSKNEDKFYNKLKEMTQRDEEFQTQITAIQDELAAQRITNQSKIAENGERYDALSFVVEMVQRHKKPEGYSVLWREMSEVDRQNAERLALVEAKKAVVNACTALDKEIAVQQKEVKELQTEINVAKQTKKQKINKASQERDDIKIKKYAAEQKSIESTISILETRKKALLSTPETTLVEGIEKEMIALGRERISLNLDNELIENFYNPLYDDIKKAYISKVEEFNKEATRLEGDVSPEESG